MVVKLRKKTNGKKTSLYLDYYHAGLRKYEFLKLYLHKASADGKLSRIQKQENDYNLSLAEQIRSKRFFELQSQKFGLFDPGKMKASFMKYMKSELTKRFDEDLNYASWKSAFRQIQNYCPVDILFEDLNRGWVEGFRIYLKTDARSVNGRKLSANTQSSYFNKLCSSIKAAHQQGIIPSNPAPGVKGISTEESERGFLTYDELKTLSLTDCQEPELKRAFLFSALTGLRWSDVAKLRWSELQHSRELNHYIRFTQKKTKGSEMLPISGQAVELLGERAGPEEQIFQKLKYSAWNNHKLQQWITSAGINKKITFHCARHTYATLQLTLGTDIYTVSKMLGHKNLKTTQAYARVVDQKKVEAANRIILTL